MHDGTSTKAFCCRPFSILALIISAVLTAGIITLDQYSRAQFREVGDKMARIGMVMEGKYGAHEDSSKRTTRGDGLIDSLQCFDIKCPGQHRELEVMIPNGNNEQFLRDFVNEFGYAIDSAGTSGCATLAGGLRCSITAHKESFLLTLSLQNIGTSKFIFISLEK